MTVLGPKEEPVASGEVPAEAEPPPDVLILPTAVREELDGTSMGAPGRPFDRRTPFFIGMTGAFGVAVAYLVVRGIADIASVLVIIGLGLFFAIGLNPILEFLERHGASRGVAVIIVTFAFLACVAGFVLVAVPPISHEVESLIKNYPRYRSEALSGKGFIGKAVTKLHLTSYLKGTSKLKLPIAGGLLGAGKAIASVGFDAITTMILTLYFLIALRSVRAVFLGTVPRSRRNRVELLTDEVFERVGGFMLGNLLTSAVSGIGTLLWLLIFGVPYPLLLALVVALFDLIPMVGSTVAGVIVSLVALDRGLAVAIGTAAFYVVYRFLEDYLLNPRVMKHTVKISPGLTIVATLIGGALIGIIGALVAIPVAATFRLLYEEVVVPRQNGR